MKTLIVTAFFDIGRDKATVKGMNRSNEKYFTYFKFWSRLNNDLVVYTQPCFMEKVASIRSEYGRKEKTIIIPIEDITEIEPDIYNKMCKIEKCNEWSKMRLNIDAMSNQAKYNYVMFLKYWCMNDALKRARGGYDQVVWMDFGFNHGGEYYTDPTDFDFYWYPEFEHGINIFVLDNPYTKNVMQTLLLQSDCVMGCLVAVSWDMVEQLWNYINEAMKALLMMECMDDDQQLLLMACKKYPDHFIIHYSDWFLPIKEFGAPHMRTQKENNGISIKRKEDIKSLVTLTLSHITQRSKRCLIIQDFGKRMKGYAKNNFS